ncbi:branched-subunit amino acid transport protein AzlD [Kineothrix alysoides]|uniref:Branched-subunit amino acid transport protein AzlD n=1 Tax=Kineothrix alysoides TaxID=1469948 RepID=A0A4R1QY95_9FIRM|nr:AzlD domain-containing protein [Kineothrix alysoides]TCL57000.1 branched-subunit amino acid transport protein AzlD [Kineothrix alysoides]
MNIMHSIAIIAVVSVCTILIRAVPFLMFGGSRQVPGTIHYLGKFLPEAIMATLVVYCLRNVRIMEGTHGLPELISVVLVAILHLWKKNILISVGLGTICYMVLIQMIFT